MERLIKEKLNFLEKKKIIRTNNMGKTQSNRQDTLVKIRKSVKYRFYK